MVRAALDARERAYAPYSRFLVGACALMADESGALELVEGANVENASYGLCICAERTAIAHAVSRGFTSLVAIAVATASTPPSPPCGMCRQVIAEFAEDDAPVVCANTRGERWRTTSKAMLPGGFTPALLAAGRTSGARKGKGTGKGKGKGRGTGKRARVAKGTA